MNNTDKSIEQVYRCQQCGQLHRESSIAIRPGTKTLYCDQCQSEDVRLCMDDDALAAHHGLTDE